MDPSHKFLYKIQNNYESVATFTHKNTINSYKYLKMSGEKKSKAIKLI